MYNLKASCEDVKASLVLAELQGISLSEFETLHGVIRWLKAEFLAVTSNSEEKLNNFSKPLWKWSNFQFPWNSLTKMSERTIVVVWYLLINQKIIIASIKCTMFSYIRFVNFSTQCKYTWCIILAFIYSDIY